MSDVKQLRADWLAGKISPIDYALALRKAASALHLPEAQRQAVRADAAPVRVVRADDVRRG